MFLFFRIDQTNAMDYELWALQFELLARSETETKATKNDRQDQQARRSEESESPGILSSSTLPTRSDDAGLSYRNDLSPRFASRTDHSRDSNHSKPKDIFVNHNEHVLVTVQSEKPVVANARKREKPYWESSDEETHSHNSKATVVEPLATRKIDKPYWESSSSEEAASPKPHYGKEPRTSLSNQNQMKDIPRKKINNPIIQWRKQQEELRLKLFHTKRNRDQSTLEDDLLWETSSSEGETNKRRKRNGNGNGNGHGQAKSTRKLGCSQKEDCNLADNHEASPRSKEMLQEASFIHSNQESEEEEEEEQHLLHQLKPYFVNPKLGPPSDLVPFLLPWPEPATELEMPSREDTVPASINRYLAEYQRQGIQFMHSALRKRQGAILGDDMGLGKTVQVISLLAALQKKTGTALDSRNNKEREKRIQAEIYQRKKEANSLYNISIEKDTIPSRFDSDRLTPTLLIVPSSVIDNWKREFETWGYFAVSIFQKTQRFDELERIRVGISDIMICGKALLIDEANIAKIEKVPWQLIIVDEFHEFKNLKAKCYEQLYNLRMQTQCPILGLTGTLMSNNHKELWSLIDLVQKNLLGSWETFNKHVSLPIMHSRRKDATDAMLKLGEVRQRELSDRLSQTYLKRDKTDVLKDTLTTKDEKVVFCELSSIQKKLYQRILSLADYKILRFAKTPCDCGVNQEYFVGYKLMRNLKEKRDYQRRNQKTVKLKSKCCYVYPKLEDGSIDPEAVLWKTFHQDHEPCLRCPYCLTFPALQKLMKVCSHPSLLQLESNPQYVEGENEREKAFQALAFAKVALIPEILDGLPGKSYVRGDSIMDDHMMLSGKMIALDYYLSLYASGGDKVLVFAHSTRALDLIQHYVRGKGYTHVRLDGSTPTCRRQSIVDEYQKNRDIFLFLISTRAGGMGLNLTAANRVIVFDVNWNPSYDEQAQDRAYRIGQNKDVEVIRFVARGTVEELMYVRQIYKVHLKKQTLESGKDKALPQPARLFTGVDKDKDRKGELFGLENLLKYKDGTFMSELWSSKENNLTAGKKKIPDMMSSEKMVALVRDLTEEELDQIGDETIIVDAIPEDENGVGECDDVIRHDDLLRDDRGGAVFNDEDCGGVTQMAHIANELAIERLESNRVSKSSVKGVGRPSLKLPSYLKNVHN